MASSYPASVPLSSSDAWKNPQEKNNLKENIESRHNRSAPSSHKLFYRLRRFTAVTADPARTKPPTFEDRPAIQCMLGCRRPAAAKGGQKKASADERDDLRAIMGHVFLNAGHRINAINAGSQLGENCGRLLIESDEISYELFQLKQWGHNGKVDLAEPDERWEAVAKSTVPGSGDFECRLQGAIDYLKLAVTNTAASTRYLRLDDVITSQNCVFDIRRLNLEQRDRITTSYSSDAKGFHDFKLEREGTVEFLIRLFPLKEQATGAASASSEGQIPEGRLGMVFLVGQEGQLGNCDISSVCLSFAQHPSQKRALPQYFDSERFAKSLVSPADDLLYLAYFTEFKTTNQDADYFIRGKPKMPGHGNKAFVPSKALRRLQSRVTEISSGCATWKERTAAVNDLLKDPELRAQLDLLMETPTPENCRRQALQELELDKLAERYNIKPEGVSFPVSPVNAEDYEADGSASAERDWSWQTLIKIPLHASYNHLLKVGRPVYLVKTAEIERAARATTPGQRQQEKAKFHIFRAVPLMKSQLNDSFYCNVSTAFFNQQRFVRGKTIQYNLMPCPNRALEIAIKCFLADWDRKAEFPFHEEVCARLMGRQPSEPTQEPKVTTANRKQDIQRVLRCLNIIEDPNSCDKLTAEERGVEAYRLYQSATPSNKVPLITVNPDLRNTSFHQKRFRMMFPEEDGIPPDVNAQLDGLITGPAGSGKTTAELEAIFQTAILYDAQKRNAKGPAAFIIFCLGPTNKAVDNSLRRFEQTYGAARRAINDKFGRKIHVLRLYSTGEMIASEMNNVPEDIAPFANRDPLKLDSHGKPTPYIPGCNKTQSDYFKTFDRREMVNAQIVFTTVQMVLVHYARLLSSRNAVPVVLAVVDEFSQLRKPEALALRTNLPTTPFIFGGDPSQLLPSHESGVNQSWFMKALKGRTATPHPSFLREMVNNQSDLRHIRCLESNRVPDEIMHAAYPTEAATMVLNRPLPVTNAELERDAPNVFTSSKAFSELKKASAFKIPIDGRYSKNATGSCYNYQEAAAVRDLVRLLLKKGVKAKNMAVITGYKAQCTAIESHLQELAAEHGITQLPSVNTVDSNQGQERQVVILSLVRTAKDAVVADASRQLSLDGAVDDLLTGDDDDDELPDDAASAGESNRPQRVSIGFLDDNERMLVAVTRTRCKLFTLADENVVDLTPVVKRIPFRTIKHADIREELLLP